MDLNPEADHHTGSEPNPNGVFAAVADLLAAAFFSFSSSKDPTSIFHSLTAVRARPSLAALSCALPCCRRQSDPRDDTSKYDESAFS